MCKGAWVQSGKMESPGDGQRWLHNHASVPRATEPGTQK